MPTDSKSLALHYASLTLADCTTVRSFLGAADQAEALARIHKRLLPEPTGDAYTKADLQTLRPYVLLRFEEYDQESLADGVWEERGVIVAQIVRETPAGVADDETAALEAIENTVGNIVDELHGLAGQAGYLNIQAIKTGDPMRGHVDAVMDQGDPQGVEVSMRFEG